MAAAPADPAASGGDPWDPATYERFKAERTQPFDDLQALVEPIPGGRAVDLGCGTGELTARLHAETGAATTVGIDSSAAMLSRAAAFAAGGLQFERGDIAAFAADGELDLVFANASLHWVDDHDTLFARLTAALGPGGQLAVQMPANERHPSHTVAAGLAAERGLEVRVSPVLAPVRYAELLWELGYERRHVRLQVYGHELASAAEVVNWTRGTLLTAYLRQLPGDAAEGFVAEYRRRLVAALGDHHPYLFAFQRILLWGRR